MNSRWLFPGARAFLDSMESGGAPLVDRITPNRPHSRTLSTLPHTPLPRLLSGELSAGQTAAS